MSEFGSDAFSLALVEETIRAWKAGGRTLEDGEQLLGLLAGQAAICRQDPDLFQCFEVVSKLYVELVVRGDDLSRGLLRLLEELVGRCNLSFPSSVGALYKLTEVSEFTDWTFLGDFFAARLRASSPLRAGGDVWDAMHKVFCFIEAKPFVAYAMKRFIFAALEVLLSDDTNNSREVLEQCLQSVCQCATDGGWSAVSEPLRVAVEKCCSSEAANGFLELYSRLLSSKMCTEQSTGALIVLKNLLWPRQPTTDGGSTMCTIHKVAVPFLCDDDIRPARFVFCMSVCSALRRLVKEEVPCSDPQVSLLVEAAEVVSLFCPRLDMRSPLRTAESAGASMLGESILLCAEKSLKDRRVVSALNPITTRLLDSGPFRFVVSYFRVLSEKQRSQAIERILHGVFPQEDPNWISNLETSFRFFALRDDESECSMELRVQYLTRLGSMICSGKFSDSDLVIAVHDVFLPLLLAGKTAICPSSCAPWAKFLLDACNSLLEIDLRALSDMHVVLSHLGRTCKDVAAMVGVIEGPYAELLAYYIRCRSEPHVGQMLSFVNTMLVWEPPALRVAALQLLCRLRCTCESRIVMAEPLDPSAKQLCNTTFAPKTLGVPAETLQVEETLSHIDLGDLLQPEYRSSVLKLMLQYFSSPSLGASVPLACALDLLSAMQFGVLSAERQAPVVDLYLSVVRHFSFYAARSFCRQPEAVFRLYDFYCAVIHSIPELGASSMLPALSWASSLIETYQSDRLWVFTVRTLVSRVVDVPVAVTVEVLSILLVASGRLGSISKDKGDRILKDVTAYCLRCMVPNAHAAAFHLALHVLASWLTNSSDDQRHAVLHNDLAPFLNAMDDSGSDKPEAKPAPCGVSRSLVRHTLEALADYVWRLTYLNSTDYFFPIDQSVIDNFAGGISRSWYINSRVVTVTRGKDRNTLITCRGPTAVLCVVQSLLNRLGSSFEAKRIANQPSSVTQDVFAGCAQTPIAVREPPAFPGPTVSPTSHGRPIVTATEPKSVPSNSPPTTSTSALKRAMSYIKRRKNNAVAATSSCVDDGAGSADNPPTPSKTQVPAEVPGPPSRDELTAATIFSLLLQPPTRDGAVVSPPHSRTTTPAFLRSLHNIDQIPCTETLKAGVLFFPGNARPCNEVELLEQPPSKKFWDVLFRMGEVRELLVSPINLSNRGVEEGWWPLASPYTAGLPQHTEDSQLTTCEYGGRYLVHQSPFLKFVFHVGALMPNLKKDPAGLKKKRHIGNDFVVIIICDEFLDRPAANVCACFSSDVTQAFLVAELCEEPLARVSVHFSKAAGLDVQQYALPLTMVTLDALPCVLLHHATVLSLLCQARTYEQGGVTVNWAKRVETLRQIGGQNDT